MNTPKHVDPAAPVKVGWGTAATLTLAAIAVLALVAWGGTWLRGDHGVPAADGGQPAVVAAASASALRQLAACRHELTLGDAVAAAADASHRDWGSHVQAQLQLDQGKFTLAQTLALWASSKKPGPSDVRAFTTARAAWAKAPGACQTMAASTTTVDRADAAACMARRAAVQAVVATGADVNAEWAAHLQMMADKAHTDAASYSQRWRQMVQQAPATLKAYERARSRLAAAPRCGG
jgi:hypothetical protein